MRIVAENLQGLNPVVARALEKEDPGPLQKLALEYERLGAEALDINPGYSKKKAHRWMEFMVSSVQEVSQLVLFIDSPDASVVEAGLKVCRGKPVINFFTAEEERIKSFLPLAADYDAPIVAAVMDKQVPLAAEDKLAVASLLLKEAEAYSIPPGRIIFDPIVIPLGWGDGQRYARETLRFFDLLSQVLDVEPKTVIGLSNLTTRTAGSMDRQGLQSVYLSMLAAHGLSYAMINMNHERLLKTVRMIRALSEDKPFSPAEFPKED